MKLKQLLIIAVLICFIGCKGEVMNKDVVDFSELKAVPQGEWDKLASKRIYFGHQSVGYNIMNGVRDIINEFPQIKLNIIEGKDIKEFIDPVFAHSAVGENKDPYSKIDDFKGIMENGLGNKVDVAFFKFCYVDIDKDTNINKLFAHYSETMDSIKKKYPKIKIVFVSCPIRVRPKGIKTGIKRILGIAIPDELDNLKRIEFNDLLISNYLDTKRIFDLAKHEAAKPNGKENTFKTKGKKNMFLVPEYSSDGKHLNSVGRRKIGKDLLLFLLQI